MATFGPGDEDKLLAWYKSRVRTPVKATDPFTSAVRDWQTSGSSTKDAGHYPQPRKEYNTNVREDKPDVPVTRYTGGSQYTSPITPRYTAPTRQQAAPAPPPSGGYKVDPLKAALNKWRASNTRSLTEYELPDVTFDYETGVDVDTGVADFSSQQYRPPTVTSNVEQTFGPYRSPQQYEGGQWSSRPFAATNADVTQLAASQLTDPENRQRWLNLMGLGWQGIQDEVTDSAAYEKFQYDVDQNREMFGERSTWGDVGDALAGAGNAYADNAGMLWQGVQDMWSGERTPWQVAQDNWSDVQFAELLSPFGAITRISNPTAKGAEWAMNAASGLQLPFDYATTGTEVTEGLPLAPIIGAGLDAAGNNLREFYNNPVEVLSGTSETYKYFRDFYQQWVDNADRYRQATTPNAIQEATNTPGALDKQRERAYLNALGGLESTEDTFNALADRNNQVNVYNQQAAAAWEAGAMAESEEERQAHWAEAAEAGSRAWQLQNAHNMELVYQNTNIVRQLLTELILPDVTDLAAGLISIAGMTPKARRLTRVEGEILTNEEKVLRRLEEVLPSPTTAKERSDYNKALNLWTTGQARALQATDAMQRNVVTLLSDVESPRDAVILLRQLAEDPRKLINGMDAGLFQSTGILNRADEKGVVRFGNVGLANNPEAMRIYQQAAEDVLASPALQQGPLLHKPDFIADFSDAMNNAGYRYYNVATDAAEVPAAAKSGRVKSVGPSEYVVEYVGENKKVIGQSEPMTVAEARKLKEAIGTGQAAQRSMVGEVGQLMRSIVSPFYILTAPGVWATNLIAAVGVAAGDGAMSLRSGRYIDDWMSKLYGVDPTARGFRNVESAASSASQFSSRGPFKVLRNLYGQIDEQVGKRVFYRAATDAMRKTGRQVLEQRLFPILEAAGVNPREAGRIIGHLHETGMQGGDLVGEFNKLLNGQTRIFSLSDVNPTWLSAIPEESLESFYNIVRTAPNAEELSRRIVGWADEATKHWDEFIAAAPTPPQRYTWQKMEVTQDTADIAQIGKNAQKYGNVPAEEVEAATKAMADGLSQAQRNMQSLTQLVTEAADPQMRYALYNVWGQVNDLTTGVRVQLTELAERANTLTGTQKQQAWQNYWTTAQRLWTQRNETVNQLLDRASTRIASGEDFTPQLNQWDVLERTARVNEQKLWDTLRLEPQSGRYDARLAQTIEAGRTIADKAIARAYAAARRFLEVDAMDHIASAEHAAQMAGAQARAYIDRALEAALKSQKWQDYYGIRNETWRQLRQYEKAVWENATYNIVRDGIASEANTALRFDAGPDGVVELVGPRTRTGQRTNRMGPQKEVTQEQATVWDVRREDGSVTQLPDNYIPDELKQQYRGATPDDVEAAVELELDNIASAYPYQADAEEVLALRQKADELLDAMEDQEIPPSAPSRDVAERVGIEINFGSLFGKEMRKESSDLIRRTTEAGGATAGEVSHGAAFAKQQLQNIVDYVQTNAGDIIIPRGRLIGEGQNLRALDAFRRQVVPAWDNVRYVAGEYGNRMRSFSLLDFANNTRLDELMSLWMPYAFFATRTMKNSLERMMFEPHIYRRVAQTDQAIRNTQEQQDVPERYEGAVPVYSEDGVQQWLRVLPSKYWPLAGMFTMNDYADPESANTAFGFAAESMRAANLQSYPWWDAAVKWMEGEADEIYPMQYAPQGRIVADLAIKMFGAEAAQWMVPGYFENSVARELNNMAVKGDITREQAKWAHDYLWQLKNNGQPLPEAETGAYNEEELRVILDTAMRAAAGTDLQSALTSYMTGFSLRPYDTAEDTWSGAAQDYRDFKYGPDNPYGSKLAADSVKDDASLSWSKAGVWREEEDRPGVSMATEQKKVERERINQELMDATDAFITGYDGENPRPSNFEINEFKNAWMQENYPAQADDDYFVGTMSGYLDERYPSATTFDGEGFQYEGYAPEEVREAARRSAYYRAKEELDAPIYPTYPGDDATSAQWDTYWAEREQYDADKLAYEAALEARVNELINDPQEMLRATGRYVMNEDNRLVNDFTRSQPQSLDDVFGYPVRPTGAGAINPVQGPLTEEEFLLQRGPEAAWNVGLTNLAGSPEDGEAIIEQERTRYMSDLEKETRAANEADGNSGGGSGGRGWRNYSRRPWVNYGRRGYGGYRRYYGGGGGAGGNYYVPQVEARELSPWLMPDPQGFAGYRAPQMRQQLPYLGPRDMQRWQPIRWK